MKNKMKTVLLLTLPLLTLVSFLIAGDYFWVSDAGFVFGIIYKVSVPVLILFSIFLPGVTHRVGSEGSENNILPALSLIWFSFFTFGLMIPLLFHIALTDLRPIADKDLSFIAEVLVHSISKTDRFYWLICIILIPTGLTLSIKGFLQTGILRKANAEEILKSPPEIIQAQRLYFVMGAFSSVGFLYLLYFNLITPAQATRIINPQTLKDVPPGAVTVLYLALAYFAYVCIMNFRNWKTLLPYPVISQIFHTLALLGLIIYLLSGVSGVKLSFAALLLLMGYQVILTFFCGELKQFDRIQTFLFGGIIGVWITSFFVANTEISQLYLSLCAATLMGVRLYSLIPRLIAGFRGEGIRDKIVPGVTFLFYLGGFTFILKDTIQNEPATKEIGLTAVLLIHIAILSGAYFVSALYHNREILKTELNGFLKKAHHISALIISIFAMVTLFLIPGQSFEFYKRGMGPLKLNMSRHEVKDIMGKSENSFAENSYKSERLYNYYYCRPVPSKYVSRWTYNKVCLLELFFEQESSYLRLKEINVNIRLDRTGVDYATNMKVMADVFLEGVDLPVENEFKPEDFLKYSKLLKTPLLTKEVVENPTRSNGEAFFLLDSSIEKNSKHSSFLVLKLREIKKGRYVLKQIGLHYLPDNSLVENNIYRPGILEQAEWLYDEKFIIIEDRVRLLREPREKSKFIKGDSHLYRGVTVSPEIRLKQESRYKNNSGHWYFAGGGWIFSSAIGDLEQKIPKEYYGKGKFTNKDLKKAEKDLGKICGKDTDKEFEFRRVFKIDHGRLVYFEGEISSAKDEDNHPEFSLKLRGGTSGDKSLMEVPGKYSVDRLDEDSEVLKKRLLLLREFKTSGRFPIKVYGTPLIHPNCEVDYDSGHDPDYDDFHPEFSWDFKIDYIEYKEPPRINLNGLNWSPTEYVLLLNAGDAAKYCKKMSMRLPTVTELQSALTANSALSAGGQGELKLFWVADGKPYNAAGETMPEGESAPGADVSLGVRCVQ